MELRIELDADFKRVQRSLSQFAETQIPYAEALALNAIGKAVADAEKLGVKQEFPTATPFTVNSVGQVKARKARLETTIFVRDIAASYLQPYLAGGLHKLNSHALLNPKNVALNQYGNLPRNKLASLKDQNGVFVGTVIGKSGQKIDGVWKRLKANRKRGAGLKLLIRFGDALPVKGRLPWGATAQRVVDRTFNKAFGDAMAKAIATARLK